MKLCVNPNCSHADDPLNARRDRCLHCNYPLEFGNGFRATRLLQENDFSKLYALESATGQQRVLQILSLEHPRAIALLQQQAKVLARIEHPGVPKVEPDAYLSLSPPNSEEQLHGLMMEKIAGISLEEWFQHQNCQPISPTVALDWLKQLAETLHRLHQNLYFHRDIQPANILLRADGTLVLVNFASVKEVAIAYLAFARRSLLSGIDSSDEPISPSPGYAPQEQAQGKSVPQSDFFALGRTFVYLLTGSPPSEFSEEATTGKLLWQSRAEGYSPALIALIDKMMAPQTSDRPHNTAIILRQIDRIASEQPSFWDTFSTPKERPEPAVTKPSVRATKQPWTMALLLAGVLLFSIGAIAKYGNFPHRFNLPFPEMGRDRQR
ncbi:protein kinase [Oscillatoria sp. FACHB-1406]|nr:protein kinase [Oscillatoria sp. FACHB-1406]MBD2577263.1 protein kinase [Oscillatoria sp. FACHB-1406]